MLNLQHRIDLLIELSKYIRNNSPEWQAAKLSASQYNGWFTPEFIDAAAGNIATCFLSEQALYEIAKKYQLTDIPQKTTSVGIVMAGNIPLVGFHDWLCIFLSGHNSLVKLSSKDNILFQHLLGKLSEWEPTIQSNTGFAEMLKGCDAYIATGSDNSARYFDYYFRRFPSIIRRNRTSVAILTGEESADELTSLADDTHLYFGLGCRNVTKIYVPSGYDFVPMLEAMRKYSYFSEHGKYKHNYDYQLAIHLLNKQYYMTNGSVLLSENSSLFSPISQLNYEFYADKEKALIELSNNNSVQCIVGHGQLPFGKAQSPDWEDYADGVNTMAFLQELNR
ncbi:acyl-CoA reductase [Flavihumibacter profundi]|uniref:acyl-CoA reductase n=1 Tax=Flavihumibacter profundi TaxID=2716883 RepID=UPI001CC822BF|nr:acyl-CoA reductase [Flavihumibacter profundi]MBZ5857253.1 acyl-CoA reductase [Flavihumibacter profundi]